MLIEHRGRRPVVHPTATIAPTAVLSGDVSVGAGTRILHGAVLSAEDGAIRVGAECVVMEHALVRGRAGHPVAIGDHVLIGPHAHVNGATIADEVFIATGASIFPGAVLGRAAEVRINAVVQVNTVLDADAMVPISWVAVGSPAEILPPERHDEIWAIQRGLNFVGTVYGSAPTASMREIMSRQSAFYAAHAGDIVIDGPPPEAI
ncbi:gamma carbonic anhydrase family protein [Agromyces sp. NPDC056965]|uniref:gamma carbonic anhydrase family protein n=1 Tax=Agromyces sp. NPDC056965 TaxID=3345983 RepID=UPI0036354D32